MVEKVYIKLNSKILFSMTIADKNAYLLFDFIVILRTSIIFKLTKV